MGDDWMGAIGFFQTLDLTLVEMDRERRDGDGQGRDDFLVVAPLGFNQRKQACDFPALPLLELAALHWKRIPRSIVWPSRR